MTPIFGVLGEGEELIMSGFNNNHVLLSYSEVEH